MNRRRIVRIEVRVVAESREDRKRNRTLGMEKKHNGRDVFTGSFWLPHENGPEAAEGGTWEIRSTNSRPEKEQTHIKTLVVTISHVLCLMKHVYIHYLIWFSWLHMLLHNMLLWLSCSWEICTINRLRILPSNRQLLHESPKNQFQNQGQ